MRCGVIALFDCCCSLHYASSFFGVVMCGVHGFVVRKSPVYFASHNIFQKNTKKHDQLVGHGWFLHRLQWQDAPPRLESRPKALMIMGGKGAIKKGWLHEGRRGRRASYQSAAKEKRYTHVAGHAQGRTSPEWVTPGDTRDVRKCVRVLSSTTKSYTAYIGRTNEGKRARRPTSAKRKKE